jgi:hypothetical protein
MTWRRRRRRPEGLVEAEQAVQHSAERLRETRAATPPIRAIAAELRAMRARNHFAERVRAALEGET